MKVDRFSFVVCVKKACRVSALFTYVGGPSSYIVSRSFSKTAKEVAEESFGALSEWVSAKLLQGKMKGLAGW